MKQTLVALALLLALPIAAADDCDIALRPAATLLLPYFDVDVSAPQQSAAQTLFTIQNISPLPQIAAVTLWTDWGFPVIRFNIFLTGYDVQGINLYDILVHAVIAPGPSSYQSGTSSETEVPHNPTPGSQPAQNDGNPKISLTYCRYLPGTFGENYRKDLALIFTTGKPTGAGIPCPKQSGERHEHAIGYATIDVVSACVFTLPSDKGYWDELLYDNVLAGDYQQITPRGTLTVQGGPLVHIRAVSGPAPAHTFYERFAPKMSDRRQPLPSAYAVRIVDGGPFDTTLKIWREGIVGGSAPCGGYSSNGYLPFVDEVRFDEHENATIVNNCIVGNCPPDPGTPVAGSMRVSTGLQPPASFSGDNAGWLYLNFGSQSWVITSMSATPIANATDSAAIALASGCADAPKKGAQIGPAP